MSYLDDIRAMLSGQGFNGDQVSGITAGIFAESQGNPYAVNPTSGAFGIGQWLGARKASLFSTYGPNPTLAQQVNFLSAELKGGDAGGAAVLSATGTGNILSQYITKFMRPAAGAQTTGDISRGTNYLNTTGQYTPITIAGTSTWLASLRSGEASLLKSMGFSDASAKALVDPNASPGSVVAAVTGWAGLDAWFMRLAVATLAIVFIAAALFALKGGDVIQSVKGAVA